MPAPRASLRLLLVGLVLVSSCDGGPEPAAPGSTQTQSGAPASLEPAELSWTQSTLTASTGRCDEALAACATITFSFPVFDDNADFAIAALNRSVLQLIASDLYASSTGAPQLPEDLALYQSAFLEEFEELIEQDPQVAERWIDERRITVLHRQLRLVSLEAEIYQEAGGAHPSWGVALVSLDPTKARRWAQRDLLRTGSEEILRQRAENHFRKFHQLEADADLDEAGFFFEGEFALNDNFAVLADGLRFYYSPYEIAPYAAGATDLLLPWAEIHDLLRPDAPIPAAQPTTP